jgi:transposase-like protein
MVRAREVKTLTICPRCGSEDVWGVEYGYPHPERYDGISEYMCNSCKYRQGRWTGEELKPGFIESRYGNHGVVKYKASKSGR